MLKITSLDTFDALKMAIQCEMDMKQYYEKAVRLVKSDDAVTILLGLAEKEEKHRLKLIRTYSRTAGKKILYLNLGKKHKLGTLVTCGENPNEAIRQAKKNESEIRIFYLMVSRRLFQSELRQLFRDLALEEEQHIAVLESSFIEPLTLDQVPPNQDSTLMREMATTDRDQATW
jgi:rubrerythrin